MRKGQGIPLIVAVAILMVSMAALPSSSQGSPSDLDDDPLLGWGEEGCSIFTDHGTSLMMDGERELLVTADLNNDTLVDIAVANETMIDIYLQDGEGIDETVDITIPLDNAPSDMAIGDLTGDGLTDIVVCYLHFDKIEILTQISNFTAKISKTTLSDGPKSIIVEDFDGVGLDDIAIGVETAVATQFTVHLSSQNYSTYSYYHDINGIDCFDSIVAGDVDGDGDMDLAFNDPTNGNVSVFINDGKSAYYIDWQYLDSPQLEFGNPLSVGFTDHNGNAKSDLFVLDGANGKLSVMEHAIGTTFVEIAVKHAMNGPSEAIMFPIDFMAGDDLVVLSKTNGKIDAYYSEGQYYTQPSCTIMTQSSPVSMTFDDIDNDGDEDLVVLSLPSLASTVAVYLNVDGCLSNGDDVIHVPADAGMMTMGDTNSDGMSEITVLEYVSNSTRIISICGETCLSLYSQPVDVAIREVNGSGMLMVLDVEGRLYIAQGDVINSTGFDLILNTSISNPSSLTLDEETGDIGIVGQDGFQIFHRSNHSYSELSTFNMTIASSSMSALSIGNLNIDWDGMGDEDLYDLAMVNRSCNRVEVFYQQSDGEFSNANSETWTYFEPESSTIVGLDIRDIDGDDYDDLLVILQNGTIKVYWQEGTGIGESKLGEMNVDCSIDSFSVGDVDDDGNDELVIALTDADAIISVDLRRESVYGLNGTKILSLISSSGPDQVMVGDLNGDGRSDILCLSANSSSISIWEQRNLPPEASVYCPPGEHEEGSIIQLDASNSTDSFSDTPSLNYTWTVEHQEGTWHLYNERPCLTLDLAGVYDVELVVTDRGGLSDSLPLSIDVIDVTPQASFSFTDHLNESEPFQFHDDTGPFSQEITNWTWDLGDGNISYVQHPTHTYLDDGNYSVTLTVRDDDGNVDSIAAVVHVLDAYPPEANFTFSGVQREGEQIQFHDTSLSPEPDAIVSWHWDFGDGNWSSQSDPVHAFEGDGRYDVTLTITDDDGLMSERSREVVIIDAVPTASFNGPAEVEENSPVVYEDTTLSYDDIVNWTWSIDGVPMGHASVFTHTFITGDSSTTFTVELRVEDSDGSNDTSSLDVTVRDTSPMIIDLRTLDGEEEYDESYPLTLIVDAAPTGEGIVRYEWDLDGDGVFETTTDNDQLDHVYENNGTYLVTVRAWDRDSFVDMGLQLTVLDTDPQLDGLDASSDWVFDEDEEVELFADASGTGDAIERYVWRLDGGRTVQTLTNTTTVTFSVPGDYALTLEVWDSDSFSSMNRTFRVRNAEVVADMTVKGNGNEYNFTASPSHSAPSDILEYRWKFGDGAETTWDLRDWAVHAFPEDGEYRVTLYVRDGENGSDHVQLDLTVDTAEPVIEILGTDEGAWVGRTVTIRATVNDSSPLANVRLHYTVESPAVMAMSLSGGVYIAQIPAQEGECNITYWVEASDVHGNIASSPTYKKGVVLDTNAPAIWNVNVVGDVRRGKATTVQANIEDDSSGVSRVVLHYSFGEEERELTMVLENDTLYTVQIPAMNRTGTLQYFIEAVDVNGNSRVSTAFYAEVEERGMDLAPFLLGGGAVLLLLCMLYMNGSRAVEEAFLIYEDGRLLAHATRRLKPGMDDDILSSMLVAIQDFVRDSFKDEEDNILKRLEFGEKEILFERGGKIYIAAVTEGRFKNRIPTRMREAIAEAENDFAHALSDWDGDLDGIRGIRESLERVFDTPIDRALSSIRHEKGPDSED